MEFIVTNEGAREFGSKYAVSDAKRGNAGIAAFFGRHRYAQQSTEDLYGLGAGDDVIYRKRLVTPAR